MAMTPSAFQHPSLCSKECVRDVDAIDFRFSLRRACPEVEKEDTKEATLPLPFHQPFS